MTRSFSRGTEYTPCLYIESLLEYYVFAYSSCLLNVLGRSIIYVEGSVMSEDTYEALDAGLEAVLRLMAHVDLDKLERLVELLPKIEKLLVLLDKLDDDTIASLEKLIDLLPVVTSRLDNAVPCLEEAFKSVEGAEPVTGLKGLLNLLRDKEVQEGIGKAVAVLRVLGKCKI
ncbi:MAG: DUF1641 domain-containing protein [Desulfurococcales archaeon]|nr:DUF1641 domain-containing protein [Desulfurococcales archaeon]